MSSWRERLSAGLAKSRERLTGQLNVLFGAGVEVDDSFYDALEEALIAADFGYEAALKMVGQLRERVRTGALPDLAAVRAALVDLIAAEFTTAGDPFQFSPVTVLLVGVNGTGKTTSVGKLAKQAVDEGKSIVLGSADTFRAAAAEQLDIWAERAGVDVVRRDRGADPASVAFETVERAEREGADIALIDTAGRLHTSPDLMRELEKVQRVTRERSAAPTFTVLVIDATTGQNGLVQAREFNKLLAVDALILTKLDGTAKGGIAVAIARELGVPIVRIGVGEGIEDLRPFDPHEFAAALLGDAGSGSDAAA
ncbi:MAG: signal recognition particle-docking protein FtsY [Actinomycetes bacterium]|jgi:fused signal recognition particle receptor|nr:signal recognition particle-docking protein FtsY [Actinomycetes bacterium]